MSDVATYFTVALGVFVAVLYPIIRGFVQKQFPSTGAPGLPKWLTKYGGLAIFSLITALIVVAVYKGANSETDVTFWAALLLGFGWESTVEKLFTKPTA